MAKRCLGAFRINDTMFCSTWEVTQFGVWFSETGRLPSLLINYIHLYNFVRISNQ